MKKTTKKTEKLDYTASIKLFGRTYTGKGASVTGAIEAIKMEGFAKGSGLLSVSKGELRQDRVLTAPQVFRLFSASRLMREVTIKQVSMRFAL